MASKRINLTTALGTSLVNTLFVLDEPSIGLHPRDMGRVIEVMKRLRDAGNTLVVVEHDPQIMFAADRILDMGPGPGERGGEIVFFGPAEKLRAEKTLTAEYLSGRKRAAEPHTPAKPRAFIEIQGATEHNLKNIDVRIPLQRLVCVTGVSGSGKSTLVQDVLYAALLKSKGKPTETPGAHRALKGAEQGRWRGDGRPVADRQDHALEPGELRRRVRRDPEVVRQRQGFQSARLHAGHLQLQLRQRPLSDLLGLRLRARRDAVPLGRLPALPGLRRPALSRRDPRGEDRRQVDRRRARADGRRSGARFSASTKQCRTACSR